MIREYSANTAAFVGLVAGAAFALAAFAPAALAQSSASEDAGLPTASPGAVGMSAEGLARIGPAMQAYVDDGRLAAVVTMVARRGQVVHWEAVGTRDTATGDPVERDDIFRIYSMTKPVTSVAVMMLVEEGKVALDDPVSKFVPEFADVEVLGDGGERVAADRPMTVEHLLTHTSGLTYGFFGDSAVDRLYNQANPLTLAEDLEDFGRRVAELPLIASPGARWNYSVSTDVLGRVVEVASGQAFDAFVEERILDPLGMDDTAFWVSEEKRGRFMATTRSWATTSSSPTRRSTVSTRARRRSPRAAAASPRPRPTTSASPRCCSRAAASTASASSRPRPSTRCGRTTSPTRWSR